MNADRSVTLVSSEIGSSGGIERVFLELVIFLKQQGYKVNAVCRSIDLSLVPYLNRIEKIELAKGSNVFSQVYFTLLWMLNASRALKKLGKDRGVVVGPPCSTFNIDVVMAGSCHLAALLELHKEGKRVWLLNPMNWFIVICERAAFRQPDSTVMTPSRRTAKEIAQLYRVPPSRLAVIPHGVDIKLFKPLSNEQHKNALRESFGLPSDTTILLSVVNELERKGCFLVLGALAILKKRGINAHYVLAGRADYSKFRQVAASLGLLESISTLPPSRDVELVSLYQSSDIFVLPTKYESFGLVCMEALACGLPVISCKVGGVEDYVETGCDGWLVARAEEAIAEAIELALKSCVQKQMSSQARKKGCAYEWNNVLKPLLNVIERYH